MLNGLVNAEGFYVWLNNEGDRTLSHSPPLKCCLWRWLGRKILLIRSISIWTWSKLHIWLAKLKKGSIKEHQYC